MAALSSLLDGRTASTGAAGSWADRLVEAGMAHPRPLPGPGWSDEGVTVVVPGARPQRGSDRCLGSLGSEVPVVVVDDGSDDPDAVARDLPSDTGPG